MESKLTPTSTSTKSNPLKTLAIIILILALIAGGAITAYAFIRKHSMHTFEDHAGEETDLDLSSLSPGLSKPYNFNYSWSEQHPYIAHALGGILGDTYTNSYEAFLLNYQLGHRVFEVDLTLTSDAELVLTHDQLTPNPTDGSSDSAPTGITAATFLSDLTGGKYHRLTYRDFATILLSYPDVYLVTDSKDSDPTIVRNQFSSLVSTTRAVNPDLLNRIIIQIYNPAMLDTIMDIYPWKSVIYTLYNDPDWTPENVKAFAETSGVKYITMWSNLVTPEILTLWSPVSIKVAAHTINNLETANNLRALGVNNIYTDFLLP